METETFPICMLYIGHMHFGIQKATPARTTQQITVSQPRYWGFSTGGIGSQAAGVGWVLPDISNEPNAFTFLYSPNINDEGITCLRNVGIHWPSHGVTSQKTWILNTSITIAICIWPSTYFRMSELRDLDCERNAENKSGTSEGFSQIEVLL